MSKRRRIVLSIGLLALLGSPSAGTLAEAATFEALGGGTATAYAECVSGDGNVVGGFSSGGVGFRWTKAGGFVTLDFQPADASLDGDVLVGTRGFGEAVRWTDSGGSLGLGDLTPSDGSLYSFGLGVSADGSVVVGSTANEPFQWTASGGMTAAPTITGEAYNGGNTDISADGSVVAGLYQVDVPAPPPQYFRTETHAYRAVNGVVAEIPDIFLGIGVSGMSGDGELLHGQVANQAALWRDGNVTVIGALPGFSSSWFEHASATGDCIVGTSIEGSTVEAMIWDDVNGLRRLRDVLEDDFGLTTALADWTLTEANDVSDDCSVIVGSGFNPAGSREAWIVSGFSKNGATLSCAQPVTTGPSPTATDCLFILNVAVGLGECADPCVCAPKGSLPPSATDALLCLQTAVGQSVPLDCPCGS